MAKLVAGLGIKAALSFECLWVAQCLGLDYPEVFLCGPRPLPESLLSCSLTLPLLCLGLRSLSFRSASPRGLEPRLRIG